MGVTRIFLLSFALGLAAVAGADDAAATFRAANDAARTGDLPKAIDGYRQVAAAGAESASLYWNWAQAALARSEMGEALWALLRAREVDPGDAAVARELERLRDSANLDPAEITPVPLAGVARTGRRLHLAAAAVVLAISSLLLHALARRARDARPLALGAGISFGLALMLAAVPLAGAFAAPTAEVVRRGAPLLDAASPTAASIGTLRQGEAVVVLAESGGYLRIEDSSGARGWASTEHVWRLDCPPAAAPVS